MAEHAQDYERALKEYDEALKINNLSGGTYQRRGEVKKKLGDIEGANRDFESASVFNRIWAQVLVDKGIQFAEEKNNNLAMQKYNEAIQTDSSYSKGYTYRGKLKGALGDTKGAIQDLDRAIRLNPEDSLSYRERGLQKSLMGKYLEALIDLDEAIHLNPLDSVAHVVRGAVKESLKRYKEALLDYDLAIVIEPNQSLAYRGRGRIKIRLGLNSEGCLDLSKAGELGNMGAYDDIQEFCQ